MCNVRDVEDDLGQFPVLSDGKVGNVSKDVGGAIKRMMKKIPPSSKTNRFYRRVSSNGQSFCVNAHLGKAKIRDRMRQAFKRMGILNWEKLHPHVLRGIFITRMANSSKVNLTETMVASRHNSVSASAVYQKRGVTSEANRIDALLGFEGALKTEPKTEPKEEVAPKKEEMVEASPPQTQSSPILLSYKSSNFASLPEQDELIITPSIKHEDLNSSSSISSQSQKYASYPDSENETSKKYSVHTQYEVDELEKEIKEAARAKEECKKKSKFEGQVDCRARVGHPHIPSKRQKTIRELRNQVRRMEMERLEDLEDREFDRMSRFVSYPFNDGGDEGLVNDSIMNDDENEAIAYRNFRRRKQIKKNEYRY